MSTPVEVAQIAAGRRRGKEHAVEIGLRRRCEFPSRRMIIRSDGTIYWPRPGEGALKGEVMLGPLMDELEDQWSAAEVLDAIVRKDHA